MEIREKLERERTNPIRGILNGGRRLCVLFRRRRRGSPCDREKREAASRTISSKERKNGECLTHVP